MIVYRNRHAELVSASTVSQAFRQVAWWMLKQVQHDGFDQGGGQ